MRKTTRKITVATADKQLHRLEARFREGKVTLPKVHAQRKKILRRLTL